MIEALPVALPLPLLLACWLGWKAQLVLPDRHRSRETVEAVRLVLGMLVTFAAIVLGLLTSTSKTHFDAIEASLQAFSVDLISMDQSFRQFGPAAEPDRALLRAYAAAAVADTWPEEPAPAGSYPRHPAPMQGNSEESLELGDMLLRVDRTLGRLSPASPSQQELKAELESRMDQTLQQRWAVLAAAHPTTTWPFLGVMALWLMLVFGMFGLSSPANVVVYAAVGATALSVSAAMWLIIELNNPLSGWLKVSSAPLREALAHMDLAASPPLSSGGP